MSKPPAINALKLRKRRLAEAITAFIQDSAVGERSLFYELKPCEEVAPFVTPGLYLLRGDYEPEDDDLVVRSANGAVMRWTDVKSRWRSDGGRQVDGVLLAVFERII